MVTYAATGHAKMAEEGQAVGDAIYKSVCPICGAVREDEQIGLEETPEEYIAKLVDVFREVKRVLKDDGTLWVNIGDSYAGSGKGRYADGHAEGGGKQQTNQGSIMGSLEKSSAPGCKPKDLIGIPWMLAFALRNDGWYLRQDIIWNKRNPMPQSVTDRCVTSHEYIFLLSKSQRYFFDYEAIQEIATGYDGRKDTMLKGSPKYEQEGYFPSGTKVQTMAARGHERWKFKNLQYDGQAPNSMHLRRAEGLPDDQYPVRNKRDVWTVATKPYTGAHFATYPSELIEPCILAGSAEGDTVLDPFNGAATTGVVCINHDRNYIGIELNPEYIEISEKRLAETQAIHDAEKAQLSLF